jgi:hypothetical protein
MTSCSENLCNHALDQRCQYTVDSFVIMITADIIGYFRSQNSRDIIICPTEYWWHDIQSSNRPRIHCQSKGLRFAFLEQYKYCPYSVLVRKKCTPTYYYGVQ